jgi:hypothetical protein
LRVVALKINPEGRKPHEGRHELDGVSGEKLNNLGIGLTLGYQINDNLNMRDIISSIAIRRMLPGSRFY